MKSDAIEMKKQGMQRTEKNTQKDNDQERSIIRQETGIWDRLVQKCGQRKKRGCVFWADAAGCLCTGLSLSLL